MQLKLGEIVFSLSQGIAIAIDHFWSRVIIWLAGWLVLIITIKRSKNGIRNANKGKKTYHQLSRGNDKGLKNKKKKRVEQGTS